MRWSIVDYDDHTGVVNEDGQTVCSNEKYYPASVCSGDQRTIVFSVNTIRVLNKLIEAGRCKITIDGDIYTDITGLEDKFGDICEQDQTP